jgi:hypothetical protein
MNRPWAGIALVAIISGCQAAGEALPTPSPSPTPHTLVSDAILRVADVQAGLQPCPGTGAISVYIAYLQTSQPALAQTTARQWLQLHAQGATNAAVATFASDPTACAAELAATSSAKAESSFVVAFSNAGQADRAWQAGVLGFTPPAPGEQPPGLTRGTGTGLGESSWTYVSAPVRLASWRKSVFVAVVVTTNLDASALKDATAAVDARLN